MSNKLSQRELDDRTTRAIESLPNSSQLSRSQLIALTALIQYPTHYSWDEGALETATELGLQSAQDALIIHLSDLVGKLINSGIPSSVVSTLLTESFSFPDVVITMPKEIMKNYTSTI